MSPTTSKSDWKAWIPLLLFGVVWVDLIRQLSYAWGANEQYAFGWFVPPLSLGLFVRRWGDRPEPQPGVAPQWLGLAVILAALALLPVRLVYEINPDWPLPAFSNAPSPSRSPSPSPG